jgi:hypothetical protein
VRGLSLFGFAKRVVAVLVVLAAFTSGWSAAPDRAGAAPCPPPTFGLVAGDLSIQGTPPCAEEPERFAVHCEAGTVRFEYAVNDVLQGQVDTAVTCGYPARLSVYGNAGDDTIDLSQVTPANGFSGIAEPNLVEGGSGKDELVGSRMPSKLLGGTHNDIILARNGVRDVVDCGQGTDAVQADQAGIDALSNCELMDLLPTTAPVLPTPAPAASVPTSTGRRVAAERKCRKLKGRKARRKCFRHARALPI